MDIPLDQILRGPIDRAAGVAPILMEKPEMTVDARKTLHVGSLAAVLGVILASPSFAQAPSMPDQQQFRDPKTGQIWTPQNVGGKSGPNTPQDRAFNPQGQTAAVQGVVVQSPTVTILGSVPITTFLPS